MYILEVIPLTLLPPNMPQILSYFFDSELPKGSIVEVSINKRRVKAVVIVSNLLEKQKLKLKKVDFQIKKINKVLFEKPQVSDHQLKIAGWIAKYYYAPLGYTLKTILPLFAFNPLRGKSPEATADNAFQAGRPSDEPRLLAGRTPNGTKKQLFVYKTKKLASYLKPLIKEAVKQSKQVLVLVPEKTFIEYFLNELADKLKVSAIHSGLPNKETRESWEKIESGETNLVIGTRQALTMPFKNLGLVIVDDPLHEFYKSDRVPRYNAVKLAQKIAELNNAQLILTSVIPGVENYHHYSGQTTIVEPRPEFKTEIIDMAQEIKNGNWSVISKKLGNEIFEYIKNNNKVLIFSPRRGYAGIVICQNCGSAVKCPQCEVAMRTHRSVEMILVCHHCGVSKPLPKNCVVCGNYNLKMVGPAGTQKIYDEIKSRFVSANVNVPVLVLDADVVKNETEEDEIIKEIKKPGSAILIATQMVFSHRFRLNFDLIAVINADALTNIPDYKSEENLFYQVEKLVNFLPAKLIIQTYNPENKLLEKAAKGEYEDFYENELKLREALYYPPFYKLIKLTFKHKAQDKASYAARITTEKLKMAVARTRLGEEVKIIEATPAYIEKERGLYIYNIFLKVREDYDNMGQILKYTDPGWIIDVEPRSLL